MHLRRQGFRFNSWEAAAEAMADNHSAGFRPILPASDWLAMARRLCREQDGKIR